MIFDDFIGRAMMQVFVVGVVVGTALVSIALWLWTHVGIVWPWFWK